MELIKELSKLHNDITSGYLSLDAGLDALKVIVEELREEEACTAFLDAEDDWWVLQPNGLYHQADDLFAGVTDEYGTGFRDIVSMYGIKTT